MLVLCVGCFDLLHVGHKRHLEEAATFGTLIVGVTRDSFVNKPGRPIIPEADRLEMILGLRCVTEAALVNDSIEALQLWHPDFFIKGSDYIKKGLLDSEIVFCKNYGVGVRFTSPNPQTTTSIIERINGTVSA